MKLIGILTLLMLLPQGMAKSRIAQPSKDPVWASVTTAISEQKFQSALDQALVILKNARAQKDERLQAEALIKCAQLQLGLHGFETAVRFLKDEAWPKAPADRILLDLYYGQSLMYYQQAYGYEIGQREKTVSKEKVDLKAWTNEQIGHEIDRTFDQAMDEGEDLNTPLPDFFAAYINANTYPPGIRSTLRDAIVYLSVNHLANKQFWTAQEANETFRLDVGKLLSEPPRVRIAAADEKKHPLEKIAAWLGEHARFHADNKRPNAMLEARYTLATAFHVALTEESERQSIRDSLAKLQKSNRSQEWWARGQALLADFIREEDRPGKLIDAHNEALAGKNAFPDSIGGKMCAAILFDIEAPSYSLSDMRSDAAEKRSILVTYKNFHKIYFRAFKEGDLEELLKPRDRSLRDFLRSNPKPDAQWSLTLPQTTDFSEHRAFVTPPALKKGSYLIVASTTPNPLDRGTSTQSVELNVTDLLLFVHSAQNQHVEVRAMSGEAGVPVKGAKVTLYKHNYNTAASEIKTLSTDADGYADFSAPPEVKGEYWNYFFIASHGDDITSTGQNVYFGSPESPPRESLSALVYTDRAIYRPEQKLDFKVVAYRGKGDDGHFQTADQAVVVPVELLDPNNQKVGELQVKLGEFGTGAGEFTIPTGRPLGNWRVQVRKYNGSAMFRVEEYKRPTFEAELNDAKDPMRLNRKVHLLGNAKYYFGLPVSAGSVRWRVTRTEVTPWWWDFWGWTSMYQRRTPQTVAQGASALGADGTFKIEFVSEVSESKSSEKGISYSFTVAADVSDEGGETRSTSKTYRLGFVSVEAKLNWTKEFFRTDAPIEIQTTLSNLDGKPRPGVGQYKIVRLNQPEVALPADLPREQMQLVERRKARGRGVPATTTSFSTPDDGKRARWETEFHSEAITRTWTEGETVANGTVKHDASGLGTINSKALSQSGVYRVIYETTDDFGAKFNVARDFFVVAHDSKVALPLVALAESSTVEPGQKARFFVHSGLPKQKLTIETFRNGKRIGNRTMNCGKDSDVFEVPVTMEDRGGFTVTASGLRDHQLFRETLNIDVPWRDRELKLEFATFRDLLHPGEKETFRVTVKDNNGKPLGASGSELLAYMYDRSLDLFAPYTYPSVASLYPHHTGQPSELSSLGVGTGTFIYSDLPTPPTRPYLIPDSLRFESGYGVGGPGHRGGRMRVAEYAAESEMADNAAVDKVASDAFAAPTARAEKSADQGLLYLKQKPESNSPPTEAPPEMRSNFSETAFFQPHLLTDRDGSAAIEFSVPDSVTSWKMFAHALTRDMRGGSVQRELRTAKELMVRPYVPRFLREGDSAEIKVTVNNTSTTDLDGTLLFDIEDPTTGKSVVKDFSPSGPLTRDFHVAKSGSATLGFKITAPKKIGGFAFKVSAKSGHFSDGELRPFPVLPSRMHLTQSRFVTLKNTDSKVMEFKDLASGGDPSRINEQMVVTVDAQLFYGVLQALPYLTKYPYECVEQTLNRFLSTGIVRSMFEKYPAVAKMAKEFSARKTQLEKFADNDPNRRMTLEETPWLQEANGGTTESLTNVLDSETAKAERDSALNKLKKMQLPSGAFPWFSGGPPDEYITLYLLMGLSRGLEFHVDVPKDMVVGGWRYLHGWLDEKLDWMIAHGCCSELITMVSFTLSSYPDDSWTGSSFPAAYRARLLNYSFEHWKDHSPLIKGYLALALKRARRPADAKLVWDSVMDSAKSDPELGTYWAQEDRSWLWYNDTIDTHAFSLRVQMELDEKNKHNDGLVQWLFLNKKLNHWKSTRATAEVIYSLLHYLDKGGQLGVKEAVNVKVGGQSTDFVFEPDQYTGKKNQIVIPGEKISDQATAKIMVSKTTPGFAFASAAWHFSTDKLPSEGSGDFFSVSRKYFRREHVGGAWQLKPLTEGAPIRVGDEVEVQISLRLKHEAEYVHLRDPRGAGFEPESLNSGYKWDLGISWYEETRDSGSNFFFSRLPVGEYTFKYRVRANMAGVFRVGPATVQSMYAPEFNAYSGGDVLRVAP